MRRTNSCLVWKNSVHPRAQAVSNSFFPSPARPIRIQKRYFERTSYFRAFWRAIFTVGRQMRNGV